MLEVKPIKVSKALGHGFWDEAAFGRWAWKHLGGPGAAIFAEAARFVGEDFVVCRQCVQRTHYAFAASCIKTRPAHLAACHSAWDLLNSTSMLTPRFLVGFTGHRSGYDEARVRPALTAVLVDLKAQAARIGGQLELYSGIAEGCDTLCVEIARGLDLPVHLLLPLDETEFARDFSSESAWQHAKACIDSANERPRRDSVHRVPGEDTRPECYFNLAVRMLDAVDVLVTVWDGQPGHGMGGTAQVIAQAGATGVPVIQIDAGTGQTTPPQAGAEFFKPDAVMQEIRKFADDAGISWMRTAASTPDDLQACLDTIANTEADRFRPSAVCMILLQGVATLLAVMVSFKVADDDPWDQSKWLLTLVEMVLVCVALYMGRSLKKKHTQEKWIRCRFACELVRGMRSSIPLLDPLHPQMLRQDPAWGRFALSMGLFVLENQTTTDPLVLRKRYIDVRLSETHVDGQIGHYSMMQPTALWWWHFTGKISAVSAALAPCFVFLALAKKLGPHVFPADWLHEDRIPYWLVVTFMPIALPMLAGVASSLRLKLDAGRRQERYPQMVTQLSRIKSTLQGLCTPSTIQAEVALSEHLLLDELLEWRRAMISNGS